tara:strand:+ start:1759 stop:1926 length:168 start_codon:yes stop_codon:yes gene_type:complete
VRKKKQKININGVSRVCEITEEKKKYLKHPSFSLMNNIIIYSFMNVNPQKENYKK